MHITASFTPAADGMLPHQNRGASRSRRAFSLIEVVLALGVTSFALLGMAALLPIGLSTTRQASNRTTEADLVQYVRNELELTSFTNLTVWSTIPLYFDDQGLPTTSTDPERIYTATLAVKNLVFCAANSSSGSPLFINTGPANNSTNAMLVEVTISNRTMAGPTATNVFPVIVPNAGF